jgi:hypothetical protein
MNLHLLCMVGCCPCCLLILYHEFCIAFCHTRFFHVGDAIVHQYAT